jgi:hypothetical protein
LLLENWPRRLSNTLNGAFTSKIRTVTTPKRRTPVESTISSIAIAATVSTVLVVGVLMLNIQASERPFLEAAYGRRPDSYTVHSV